MIWCVSLFFILGKVILTEYHSDSLRYQQEDRFPMSRYHTKRTTFYFLDLKHGAFLQKFERIQLSQS